MRIIFTTLAKCWILIQTQSPKELSDVDSDEGPLRKHRRLTFDHWTAVSATMDRIKKEQNHRDVLKNGSRTRDVGVLCSKRVPVNDKCIMVGTTGIAALKAEYGDDFTNFEIIQDVGYSSESSTHLSGDDTGTDHHFVRIYKYSKDNQPLNLRQELEAVAGLKNLYTLGSSLESSSSAAVSLDDSGLGTGETTVTVDSSDVVNHFRGEDEYEQDDLDYLETVLDECVDFGVNALSEPEELHFNISGIESDDPSDNFHNRSSFTTSAQKFYKMISVDSDNGEGESPTNDNNISSLTNESDKTINNNNTTNSTLEEYNNNTKTASDSESETYKPIQDPTASSKDPKKSHRLFCSTPVRNPEDKNITSHRQGLKRKRDHDAVDTTRMSNRVRTWLNRCIDFSTHPRKPIQRCSPDVVHKPSVKSEDISSCDASCECTSSSADEGNVYSSTSSFFEDDVFKQKTRVDSCSAEGSVETVLHALLDPDFILLPPPPSSSASYGSDSKNCSTVCCRKNRRRCKASSEGDLRKQSSLKKASNLSSSHAIQKRNSEKQPSHPSHRLYSSLPNVLRHPSDSSTDENFIPSTQLSHSDTRTTTCNRSSSSEVSRRRRRSRKKSSSSNRSNTSVLLSSGDQGRHRSRTYTSSTSRCGSRRRHRSQRSEFICAEEPFSDEEVRPLKVEIPVEENVGFDDLRRASSVLLSPVESDIVLTHLEEQSTVSDQVWDGYQEMPYLSEGYSEATVDEDAVRKLTEFGDDYGSAIGLPLRLLEPSAGNKNNKTDCAKPIKKSSKQSIPANQRLPCISGDSDSDSEDLHYVIEESGKALHFARAILSRKQEGDPLSSADYAELLATCGTHLRCLQTICEHINIDGKEHSFSSSDLAQLHYLIEEWRDLRRSTEMFQKSEDPANLKYLKAQENIDALYNKMSHISSCSYLDIGCITSWEDVQKNMSRLQMVLSSLQEAKEQLLAVNLQVHRFTTEYSSDANYKDCSLKSDITELYRQWEDVYEQNGDQLTQLEGLKSDWESFEEKFRNLRLRVKETEFSLNDDCDNICLTSTTNSTSLREDFEHLKRDADSLENRLQGGEAWKKIETNLQDLKRKIDRQDASLRTTTSLSMNHRSPSTVVEEDADDHFEDAIQQLCEDDDHSGISPLKKEKTTAKSPKRRKSRFWRIVRVAVPVQLALVLLYCLACYLEPSCCNMLNNFNFSFTPQLRYFGSRPPV